MKRIKEHTRFGLINGDTQLFAWQKEVLEKLVSQQDIELNLVVLVGNQTTREYSYHQDHTLKKSAAFQQKKSDDLFKGVEKISGNFIELQDGIVQLEDEQIARIESTELDFILNFCFVSLTGKVLESTKFGVWQFQFGNPEKYKDGIPCFWEIYHQDVVTSGYLVRLTDEESEIHVLHQGHLKTSISYKKNSNKFFKQCTTWPLKVCEDIRNNATGKIGTVINIENNEIKGVPSTLQTLVFPFIQAKLVFKKAWLQLFFTDYWNIGIVHAPIQEFLNPEKKHTVQWFPDLPKTRFMADPFGLYFKDQLHIVYEDLKFDEGIGKTASFLFDEDEYKENEIVIAEEFHMSYPFLFEKDGEVYCVPETYQANEVRLYKALDFPTKWAFDKVLIENYAGIDSTLYEHDRVWFMFSTDKTAGPHFNLNIHFAENFLGPWEPHPKNPVKTDIRSARPAGTLFEEKGELFRPSMDYSEKIEGRITINKIITLNKQDFKEEAYHIIQPFENTVYSDKVHTLSKFGPYTLVDGAKELFILSNFNAFKYKMKRVLNKLNSK